MKTVTTRFAITTALALGAFNLVACSSGDASESTQTVTATKAVAQAESLEMTNLTGGIVGVLGSYGANCTRPGAGESVGDTWFVPTTGHSIEDAPGGIAPPMAGALKVVAGDYLCQLTLTGFVTSSRVYWSDPINSITLVPFFSRPVPFTTSDLSATPIDRVVSVSAMISTLTFEDNFNIQLDFASMTVNEAQDNYALQRVTTKSLDAMGYPAPTASADFSSIITEVDGNNTFTAASGSAVVTPDGYTADQYMIYDGDLSNADYGTVDMVYKNGFGVQTMRGLGATGYNIDASFLDLVGASAQDGPVFRSVIFASWDAQGEQFSYEVVVVRFYGSTVQPPI